MGNTSDGVIIYDFRNGIIDNLFTVQAGAERRDIFLERISVIEGTNDSTNWVTSLDVNGSTPGKQNSIFSVPAYQSYPNKLNYV